MAAATANMSDISPEAPMEAAPVDLLADIAPLQLRRTVADQFRSSVKRSLEMFSGNAGVPIPKALQLLEPKETRIKLKIDDEFGCLAESKEEDVQESATAEHIRTVNTTTSTTLQLLNPTAAGSSVLAQAGAFSVPGSSSNALQHLTFRRFQRAPKAIEHPEWELMRVISGHQGWVRALAVDPSNEWFVSGGNDRLIKVWDLATGTLKLSLTGHINTIRALEVSHRHPYLFSCGEDQMIKCWDLEYNKVIRHYHGHLSGVYSMALHPSLDILSTGGRDAVVRVWDMRTKLAVHVLSGHTGTVMSLASQRAEPQIISGSLDKMVRCWDLAAGKTSVVLTHHKKAIRSLALHPREYTFCSAGADHLKVWKCPKARFERNLDAVSTIMNSITIRDDPESAIVIGGSDQGHLHFWDWASGKKFQTIETIPQPGSLSSEKAIYAVKLDMSETRLFTAECDKTIKVWREKAQ